MCQKLLAILNLCCGQARFVSSSSVSKDAWHGYACFCNIFVCRCSSVMCFTLWEAQTWVYRTSFASQISSRLYISPYSGSTEPLWFVAFIHSVKITRSLLHVLRARLKNRGDRAFSVVGSKLWNSLQVYIRSASISSLLLTRICDPGAQNQSFIHHWLSMTSDSSWINNLSIDVWFVMIGQYLKIWNLRKQKNLNIEKIIFIVV